MQHNIGTDEFPIITGAPCPTSDSGQPHRMVDQAKADQFLDGAYRTLDNADVAKEDSLEEGTAAGLWLATCLDCGQRMFGISQGYDTAPTGVVVWLYMPRAHTTAEDL
ncbi:hypothetical protein [Salininema proteolyticum]|uniref:Uncharacterized protein n=1 Tax=Salininema proteolyticum TaxID=1607685 RepID=A0ABV8TTU2_9ACTN